MLRFAFPEIFDISKEIDGMTHVVYRLTTQSRRFEYGYYTLYSV